MTAKGDRSETLRQRIDEVLQQVQFDEIRFNKIAQKEHLGVFLSRGRVFPELVGQTHAGRLFRMLG